MTIASVVATTACASVVRAQSSTQPAHAQTQPRNDRQSWIALEPRDRAQIEGLLKDPDWPIRVFALLRLERFEGDELPAMIRNTARDNAWQVRCFALRQAARMAIDVDAALLAEEMEPKVLRAALRSGVDLPSEQIRPHLARLLKTRGIDELMLGIELAALSDLDDLRLDAQKRAVRLIRNMDDAVALLIGQRLAMTLVGIHQTPADARAWRAWLTSVGDEVSLIDREAARRVWQKVVAADAGDAPPLIAQMDDETLTRLLDYLASLRQRDLDLVIVMDATASMIPMINQARVGVDALILFLNDISREMRLAFIAYRDHDNKPVWDGHPFTTDIASIRKYLFDLRITGGADYPEAVLDGFTACNSLKWNREATREIVLVGDAPPHEQDVYQVHALMDSFRDSGITVHAVHVPMAYRAGHYDRLTPEQAEEARQFLEEYNASTRKTFTEIADAGGGRSAQVTDAEQLVPSIMHFTIEEAWWPVFDEFYAMYRELCR